MRHKKLNKRFGRNKSQRKQLMRSLVRGLFIYYRIETTAEKAKEARRLAEKLISLSKKATLADIRAIDSVLQDRTITKNLIQQISPLFKQRNSGYTRVIRTGFRRGDGVPLAILELTEKPAVEKKPKKEKKEKPPAEVPPTKEEKKELPEKKILPPEAEKKPPEIMPEEKKPKKKEEKPKEKPAPRKIGLFERFKRFLKKATKR